jgi:hypothetical protein
MVSPRFPGEQARLSPFLTGTTTFDRVTGPRVLNDLRRRMVDMHRWACPGEPLPEPPPPPDGGTPGGAPDAGPPPPPPPRPTMPPPPSTMPPSTTPGAAPRTPSPAGAAIDPDHAPSPSLSRGIGRVH